MEIPIYIDGAEAGTLALTQEGSGWTVQAKLRDIGRVARLTLYGAGGSVYLGIPEPQAGAMTLTKHLPALKFIPEYCAETERRTEESPPAPPREETPSPPVTEAPETERSAKCRVWLGGRPYYF